MTYIEATQEIKRLNVLAEKTTDKVKKVKILYQAIELQKKLIDQLLKDKSSTDKSNLSMDNHNILT